MKKNLAFLLAVVLAFTSMLGLSAAATEAEETDGPAAVVNMITVSMRASLSIYFAVEREPGYEGDGVDEQGRPEVRIMRYAGENDWRHIATATYVGTLYGEEEGAPDYWIYEYVSINPADYNRQLGVGVRGHESNPHPFTVEQVLNKYIGTTQNESYKNLAEKFLIYGKAVAAYGVN